MIDMMWISALLFSASCLALGYVIRGRYPPHLILSKCVAKKVLSVDGKKKSKPKEQLDIEKLADIIEDFKMVLVVRNDLKMGKGKIAVQCRWEMCGQVKIVVKIESEEELLVLQEKAKSITIATHVTIDAGRTQIAPNSRTVMAILGPADMVDDVTGGLKLL